MPKPPTDAEAWEGFVAGCVWWHNQHGWFFVDETWANWYGPYNTEEECLDGLDHYCKTVLGVTRKEVDPNVA